jgi:hypothetical protein
MTDRDWHLYRAEQHYLDSIHTPAWLMRLNHEHWSWFYLLRWAGWRE